MKHWQLGGVTEISAKKLPAGFQYARRRGQELFHGRIAVGGFDVYHQIKTIVIKRECLSVARLKVQLLTCKFASAELNDFRGKIDPDTLCRLQVALDVAQPAAATTTDFQQRFALG